MAMMKRSRKPERQLARQATLCRGLVKCAQVVQLMNLGIANSFGMQITTREGIFAK
jgi:hypothetical protein